MGIEHTSLALDNATNKLAALQHSQFVENRVYEDDEITITETKTNANSTPSDVKDVSNFQALEL